MNKLRKSNLCKGFHKKNKIKKIKFIQLLFRYLPLKPQDPNLKTLMTQMVLMTVTRRNPMRKRKSAVMMTKLKLQR